VDPVWTGAENLATTGIRSPDRPARSQSLYRQRYPGTVRGWLHSLQHKRQTEQEGTNKNLSQHNWRRD
jgi:hypothetical protein